MQILVEIGPSNVSQGQHRRKDATEQMKNLTLARTFLNNIIIYIYIYIYIYIHLIIRTAILYNEINSGLHMKNTMYIYIYTYIYLIIIPRIGYETITLSS